MQVMWNIVLGVQLLSALAMIGLVLIQHGKGADMGASFGSGASGSLFGATGSANFLSRSTAACATLFFVCTLGLAYLSHSRPGSEGSSVFDRAAATRPAASAPAPAASSAADLVPGAGTAATPAPSASSAAPAAPAAAATPAASAASGAAAVPTK